MAAMAGRFFPNEMPDFVEENEREETLVGGDPLRRLLSMPYPRAADGFLRAALDLKDKVVKETWFRCGQRVKDFTLYTGALGTAFLLLKAYQVANNMNDLKLCLEIVGACDAASRGSKYVTFICGRAGVCAVGAVAAKYAGDDKLQNHYLNSFKEIQLPSSVPNELLYGRAGYLWACSFLDKHTAEGEIPAAHRVAVAREMIDQGRKLAGGENNCPLMYEWHGKRYWGAAHGLAGIMHSLMDVELNSEEQEYVKGTLRYMIQNRFGGGNYPSSEGSESDRLVHWCHGAPGVSITLAKASQVFDDEQFLQAAAEAAEVVWRRGLLKRVGMCHGVSGNAHVFLSLYRRTGDARYLYKARAFASFLRDKVGTLMADGGMHGGDRPYSLFEGQAGMAYLFLGMVVPAQSTFPAYEL